MRRLLFALTLTAAALTAAACSADTAPGWTYAAPTVAPSTDASAAPSGDASAAPSGGSSAPTDGAVQISAANVAFEQTEVSAPADAPFTIHFNNKEAVPHNVAINDASGGQKFNGELITGPKEIDYQVPALAAGDYTFVCIVHPNMKGTLKAGS
jgi:plastocyanin